MTLDRSDTLHSAKGKLDASGPGHPVVVLAPNCRIADNVLTYRLLARTSHELGSPIAVVARNPYWRRLAQEHGLKAFASVPAIARSGSHSPASITAGLVEAVLSSLNPRVSGQSWAILATLLVVAGIAAYAFLPVMKVTILTPVEEVRQEVVAKVDASVSTLDVSSGIVPGRVIEHRFAISDTVTTAGEKNVGKERAKGEVTVLNGTLSLVSIPAGTVLSTGSGQKFSTVTAVAVGAPLASSGPPPATPGAPPQTGATPSASAGAGSSNGTATRIPVMAVEAGENGNVPALAISKFDSESFRGLTVFNEQALTGGSEAKSKVASAEDRSRLKESLFQRAQSQALAELQMRVRQSESLIPHSMQVRVEKEDYDKNLDEEGDKLKGTLSVVATAIAFANSDLNTIVDRQWRASVPKGFRAMPGALSIDPPEVLQAGSQTASLKVRTAGKAERVLEADDLSQALRGSSIQDARTKLAQLESPLRLVKLELWPEWAARAFRVEVQTVQ